MQAEGIVELNAMEAAVLHAARYIHQFHSESQRIEVHWKADKSMVMNLDIECQRRIAEKLTPILPIVAEENEASHSMISANADYFLIDPIDGTASCKRYLGVQGGQLGFGPLVGLVRSGRLVAAAYFNLPSSTLYSAIHCRGAFAWKMRDETSLDLPPQLAERRRLQAEPAALKESALIFFPGSMNELKVVRHLREHNLVENTYRFGAFANDCTRLAEGFEQIQLQVKVRAWDFSAVIIAVEAGLSAQIDPFGRRIAFDDWKVSDLNPVLIAHQQLLPELTQHLASSLADT